MTNEKIHLNENEGLEIEISRIQYEDGNTIGRPTSLKLTIAHEDIDCFLRSGEIKEDSLAKIISNELFLTIQPHIKSFRWGWNKYRVYTSD